MNTFIWNDSFMTDIPQVDTQHQTLVGIINKISESVLNNKESSLKIDVLLQELMEYTKYHFEEEENLSKKVNVDIRHRKKHIKEHHNFIEQIGYLSDEISSKNSTQINYLLDFLINWLAYHILVTDKNLAKQIKSIKSGFSPKEAYELQEEKSNSSVAPLINALDKLISQVSQKNTELLKINSSLEEKVKERTKKLQLANDKLKKLSLTDELTKIPNRRLCMQVLNSFWDDSNRINQLLSCIMLDIDHFKSINDTYGHDVGDEVLKILARTFTNSIRTDDIVCRLGGDEFLIICIDTNLEGSMTLAKEIHKKVKKLKIATGNEFWHGSVSIGIAEKKPEMINCEQLIKVADNSVYAAKSDGKNCIRAV